MKNNNFSPDFNFITSTTHPKPLSIPFFSFSNRKSLKIPKKKELLTPKPPLKVSFMPNTPSDMRISTKPFKINIMPVITDLYLPEKKSALTKARDYFRKKTALNFSSFNLKETKTNEKPLFSNIFTKKIGAARCADSIKYKHLLALNYEKILSNHFYKENEDLKDFINSMKLEGYCPKEIFYHQIMEKQMEIDEKKAKKFLNDFYDTYIKLSQAFWLKRNNPNQSEIITNLKLLASLDFNTKQEELYEFYEQKQALSSPRKRDSMLRITPKEREKFKNLVNLVTSMKTPQEIALYIEDRDDYFEKYSSDSGSEFENDPISVYFSPLQQSKSSGYSLNKSPRLKKRRILKAQKEERKIDDKCYKIVLQKYTENEKMDKLSYFDPLYDQKSRMRATKQKLLICLTKLAKMKLGLQDLTKVSSKPYQRKGSILFFSSIKARNLSKIQELLALNQLFVFDIDPIHQTTLHISCKKGFLDIVKILLKKGAEVNAYDLYYRTPLYFAIKYGEIDICRYLLYNKAYPFSSNKCNFDKEIRENAYLRYYVKEARKLYVMLVFIKDLEMKKEVWIEKRRVFCRKALVNRDNLRKKLF